MKPYKYLSSRRQDMAWLKHAMKVSSEKGRATSFAVRMARIRILYQIGLAGVEQVASRGIR